MEGAALLLLLQRVWLAVGCLPWTLLLLAAYVANYFLTVAKKPLVRCGQHRFKTFLIQHCPAVTERLWITPWCYEGRLHTTLAYYMKYIIPPIRYTKRDLVELCDGGVISLDWLETKESNNDPKKPTILILPGLNGDSQVCYIKTLVLLAKEMGYRSIVYNFRGRGGVKLCTQKSYCPSYYGDLIEVVQHVKVQLPESPLLAVGTSLGGVILGHYASSLGVETGLEAAILISCVFDLESCMTNVETRPLNIQFSRYLCSELITELKQNKHLYKDGSIDIENVLKSQVLTEFSAQFTAPNFGFRSLSEYYAAGYLSDKLKNCQIPLLAISAEDDPFQPGFSLPNAVDINGAPVALVVTRRGGHLGFQDGFNIFKPSWADRLFCQFCNSVLQYKEWKHTVVCHG